MFLKRLKKFEISPFDNSKLDSEILKKSSKNVPDLFVDDNEISTQKQTDFYNEILFPNFDDLDDFGSLIDKGQKNFFSKCLDKEIPMMSKALTARRQAPKTLAHHANHSHLILPAREIESKTYCLCSRP